MKLFDLFATLGLDTKSFESGLSKAGSSMKKTVKEIGTYSGKLEKAVSGAFKSIAKAGVVGFTAVKGASIAIGKQALDTRSSIEQGIGGAAAVFEEYAKKIDDAAKGAYNVAGLSMAGYLETANKMGALFKGSGYDVQEAADMTTQAMQRAADVASIMGIDVNAAMESVAGAAKGNFTMMDNLGVAMNDTTLEAYRLEKGMDKAVSKMTTSEKVGLAMEMFLEKTAYAAGNYARENDTVAGSLQTLKGAWSNFLGGVGDFKQVENSAFGFVINASKSMGLSSLAPALKRVRAFVDEVADIISMDDASGKQKYRAIESRIMVRGYKIFKNLGRTLPGQIADVGDEIVRTISGINSAAPLWLETGKQIFDAVRQGVRKSAGALSETAVIVAPSVISGWFTTKTDFLSIGLDILTGVANGVIEDAKSDNPQIKAAFQEGLQTVINSAAAALPALAEAGTDILSAILDGINASDLSGLSSALEKTVIDIVTWVADPKNIEKLLNAGLRIGDTLLDGLLKGIGIAGAAIVDLLYPDAHAVEALRDRLEKEAGWKGNAKKSFLSDAAPNKIEKLLKDNALNYYDISYLKDKGLWRDSYDGLSVLQEKLAAIEGSAETSDSGIQKMLGGTIETIREATGEVNALVDAFDRIPARRNVTIAISQLVDGAKVSGGASGAGQHLYLMDTAYDTGTSLRAKPFASGTPYVPYDNFFGRLHRGEMVLTRQQAEDYREKQTQEPAFDYAQMGAAVGAAIKGSVRYLSRQTRAADVVDELGRRINRRESDLVRGMGG